jgi:hypothetical protein
MDLCGFVENAKTTQDFMVYPKFYTDATTTKKKKKVFAKSLRAKATKHRSSNCRHFFCVFIFGGHLISMNIHPS